MNLNSFNFEFIYKFENKINDSIQLKLFSYLYENKNMKNFNEYISNYINFTIILKKKI